MRVYLDSSAALKRAIAESESADLIATLDKHHADGDVLVSSSLAWVEVARPCARCTARHWPRSPSRRRVLVLTGDEDRRAFTHRDLRMLVYRDGRERTLEELTVITA